MTEGRDPSIARVVVPCDDLPAVLAFWTEEVGLRLDRISPADDPRVADVSGFGVALRLDRDARGAPPRIVIEGAAEPRELRGPGGAVVEWTGRVARPVIVEVPPLAAELVVRRGEAADAWVTGRAGMRYRDLIPNRHGGSFVASTIRIDEGGPVPDHVHHHSIRFQVIYCLAGWVRVVYEDQGPSFVLEPGDCVLQPPGIRHRVLESSSGLEVLEVASPAAHDTWIEHELELPTGARDPDRVYGGQRFVRHVRAEAAWEPGPWPGWEVRETGIERASAGAGSVRVHRCSGGGAVELGGDAALLLAYVTAGSFRATNDNVDEVLETGDSITLPPGAFVTWSPQRDDVEWVEVRSPAGA